jgi:hypothetical protein
LTAEASFLTSKEYRKVDRSLYFVIFYKNQRRNEKCSGVCLVKSLVPFSIPNTTNTITAAVERTAMPAAPTHPAINLVTDTKIKVKAITKTDTKDPVPDAKPR